MDFEYPQNVRFICEKCALCCGDAKEKVRSILLLEAEVVRITRGTSKKIEEFAEKVEGAQPYVYRMRKTADGKCIFLKGGLCSIYGIRPLICKFYPFQLENTKNGRFKFTYINECPNIGKGPKLKRKFFENLFKEFMKIMGENAS
ncbi:MAG: YkgJ family cysteine cluster protein [Candidatus Bathycorpusculaceae bacterium]